MTTHDSYELEAGLKPEYDLTISKAVFQFDANYNNGQTLCLVLGGVDGDGDEQNLLYPCSAGWQPGNGGQSAEREDGAQNRTFNQQSGIGGLILAALQLGAPLRERGPATNAAVWMGLSFHFKRLVINEGTTFQTTRALPVSFLGAGQIAANGAAPAAAQTAAPAVPVPNGAATLDALTTAKLKAIAKKVATHDAFIEEGLALAADNPAVEAILADAKWFEAARV